MWRHTKVCKCIQCGINYYTLCDLLLYLLGYLNFLEDNLMLVILITINLNNVEVTKTIWYKFFDVYLPSCPRATLGIPKHMWSRINFKHIFPFNLNQLPIENEIKSCFVLSWNKYFQNISHMSTIIKKLLMYMGQIWLLFFTRP